MAGDKLSWTPEQEVALFHAMQGHKPVGKDSVFLIQCLSYSTERCRVSRDAPLFANTSMIGVRRSVKPVNMV